MPKCVKIIKADGTEEILDRIPTLKDLQKIVGGWIEHVRVLDHIDSRGRFVYTSMFVHEEGLLIGLPRNTKATEIYQKNVRAQYPDDPSPFKTMREESERKYKERGFAVIDATPKSAGADYRDDPYVTGDVVLFEGYTCDEADRQISAAERRS